MNVNIEKITNGYILTVDDVKTFCDVPEAICGTMAELILKHCKELDAAPAKKGVSDELAKAVRQLAQAQAMPRQVKLINDDHFADAWKYSEEARALRVYGSDQSDLGLLEKIRKAVLK